MPKYWSIAVDFGYMLLAAELLLGGGGYWLDRRLQTSPWFAMAGVILGLLVSFRSLMASIARAERADRK
jgi:F0F1-type ATP synthase assembly protein I